MLGLAAAGVVRAALLAGLVITGALRKVKNFSGVCMFADAIVFLDIAPSGTVNGLPPAARRAAVGKKRWTTIA